MMIVFDRMLIGFWHGPCFLASEPRLVSLRDPAEARSSWMPGRRLNRRSTAGGVV